ncbi:anthranilate synthase component I [Helicobacter pylori]|nr:anthranilate synthase component I [Helicobacter pylori]
MKHQSNTPCFLKALEIESKACNQTPFNGSSFLKRIDKHNIVKSLA